MHQVRAARELRDVTAVVKTEHWLQLIEKHHATHLQSPSSSLQITKNAERVYIITYRHRVTWQHIASFLNNQQPDVLSANDRRKTRVAHDVTNDARGY